MPRSRKKLVPKKVKKVRSSTSKPNVSETSEQEDSFSVYLSGLQNLSRQIKQSGVLHVNSDSLKKKVRNLVKTYFETIRIDLLQHELEVSSVDGQMQTLLSLANSRARVSAYTSTLGSLEEDFRTLESQKLITQSNKLFQNRSTQNSLVIIGQDKKILDLLSKILPAVALSYQQVLVDISQSRVSYKGTAAEQREILREVLDYLAPDAEVVATTGFKLEKDRTVPTMKQKVRFILKNRNKSQSAIEVPESATVIVEESIAKLARATYNRGSLSTHTATEKTEVLNLKRYLDSVLCELLEIY